MPVQPAAAHALHVAVELVDQRGDRCARAVAPRLVEPGARSLASSRQRATEVKRSSIIVGPRWSICQLCAALLMTCSTCAMSSPARARRGDGLARSLHQAGDAGLVDHLNGRPAPGPPTRVTARIGHGHQREGVGRWLCRRITVSTPFPAPGLAAGHQGVDRTAGRARRRRHATAHHRRRHRVVWSTNTAPADMRHERCGQRTLRRSSSLPTQANTNSAPATPLPAGRVRRGTAPPLGRGPAGLAVVDGDVVAGARQVASH